MPLWRNKLWQENHMALGTQSGDYWCTQEKIVFNIMVIDNLNKTKIKNIWYSGEECCNYCALYVNMATTWMNSNQLITGVRSSSPQIPGYMLQITSSPYPLLRSSWVENDISRERKISEHVAFLQSCLWSHSHKQRQHCHTTGLIGFP